MYSYEIIKLNDDVFLIKNYKKHRKLFAFLLLLCSIIFLFMIFLFIKDKNYDLFSILFCISAIVVLIYSANDIKEININIKKQKISFKYGLFFKKIKEINIDDLKEISINNSPAEIPNRAKRIIGKNYNVDLIDKNLNAYRINRSLDYTDALVNFANNISKIINVELFDRNSVEGYMNIYKKIII